MNGLVCDALEGLTCQQWLEKQVLWVPFLCALRPPVVGPAEVPLLLMAGGQGVGEEKENNRPKPESCHQGHRTALS